MKNNNSYDDTTKAIEKVANDKHTQTPSEKSEAKFKKRLYDNLKTGEADIQ